MLKRVVLACVFLASVPANAGGADEYANIRTIGVISAIGDSLTLKNVGFTVFTNSTDRLPIQDWGIDGQITRWITQALSKRFSIIALPEDAVGFYDCENFKECVAAIPRRENVDAYLIVYKTDGQLPGTNQTLTGLGLSHQSIMIKTFTGMFAMYGLAIVDARTGKQIDYGTARLPLSSLSIHSWPLVTTDDSYWADSAGGLTEDQKQQIKVHLTRLVEISLPMAIHNLGLGPETNADTVSPMMEGTEPIPYFAASDVSASSPVVRPSNENNDPQPCTNCTPYQ